MMNKYNDHTYSIIVFSQRCTLKKISVESQDVIVLKRDQLTRRLNRVIRGRQNVIDAQELHVVFEHLRTCTEVSDAVKSAHIENILEFKVK